MYSHTHTHTHSLFMPIYMFINIYVHKCIYKRQRVWYRLQAIATSFYVTVQVRFQNIRKDIFLQSNLYIVQSVIILAVI
jgi:hypothetical protein